jgi:hypothetical protein
MSYMSAVWIDDLGEWIPNNEKVCESSHLKTYKQILPSAKRTRVTVPVAVSALVVDLPPPVSDNLSVTIFITVPIASPGSTPTLTP